jgi:hypothetical protein
MDFTLLADAGPGPLINIARDYGPYALGAFCVIALFLFVLVKLFSKGKKNHNQEKGLKQNLADCPPPPKPGARGLEVNGVAARIRLIVLAPAGNVQQITMEKVDGFLDGAIRGLSQVAKYDKPRIVIWPAQLSLPGFAPTFHRNVSVPGSEWIKIAGPVEVSGKPVLLGMALLADEETDLGEIDVQGSEWVDAIDVIKHAS